MVEGFINVSEHSIKMLKHMKLEGRYEKHEFKRLLEEEIIDWF